MVVRKILTPVAAPDDPGTAALFSIAMARKLDAAVTLLHVVEQSERDESGRDEDNVVEAERGMPVSGGDAPADSGDETASMPVGRDSTEFNEPAIEQLPMSDAASEAEGMLKESLESLPVGSAPVAVMVTEGDPAERIPSIAHLAGFDLVIMEGLRKSRLARLLFGSTADQVKSDLQIPVVMLQPDEEAQLDATTAPDAVIVPLDREPDSEHVVALAQEFAQGLGVVIEFVHAVPDSMVVAHPAVPVTTSVITASGAEQEEAREYLDYFVKDSEAKGLKANATVEPGYAVSVIQKVASNYRNAMIFTDSTDRSGFFRLVMGSVPEDLVNETSNPVLVAPHQIGAVID